MKTGSLFFRRCRLQKPLITDIQESIWVTAAGHWLQAKAHQLKNILRCRGVQGDGITLAWIWTDVSDAKPLPPILMMFCKNTRMRSSTVTTSFRCVPQLAPCVMSGNLDAELLGRRLKTAQYVAHSSGRFLPRRERLLLKPANVTSTPTLTSTLTLSLILNWYREEICHV